MIEVEEGDFPKAETDTGKADLEIDTGDQGAETGGGVVKGGRENGLGVERGKVNPEYLFLLLEEEQTARFISEMSEVIHQTCPLLLRRGMPGELNFNYLLKPLD